MRKMVVGMVGVGGFGTYRRQTMRDSGLFTLAAVCDRSAETLEKAAKEEGAKAAGSFDELLKFPGLEGIVISTGADSHAPFAIAAMKAGLHVFVEKPLCSSVAEVQALRSAQRETGRVVGMGHAHNASQPTMMLVRHYIDSGMLGTVTAYEENSSHSGGLIIKPGDWRGLAAKNPGGMLFQCGVHCFHSLTHLFGPVKAVAAMMRYDVNPNTETADAANVLCRHESGMIGTLNTYHTTAYLHELRVFGTGGNLYVSTHDGKASYQKRLVSATEERVAATGPAAPAWSAWGNLKTWYEASVLGKGEADPSLEHGVRAVLPVFAAEVAAKEKREVEVGEIERRG